MPRGVYEKTPEHRAKLSVALQGHPMSAETRTKIGAVHRGLHHTPEAKAKMSAKLGGGLNPSKRPEVRAKISAAKRGVLSAGDAVGYVGRHGRVYRARGKASGKVCVDCGGPADQWSQIHGTTGLDVFADYEPRCIPCHRRYDRPAAA